MFSTARNSKALLKAAIRSDNPVIFFEHVLLYNVKGPVGDKDEVQELNRAEVVREGSDITLFGYNLSTHWNLEAAEVLSREHGIEAEVIDLYALSPLDREGIVASVSKTHRALISEEAEAPVGVGSEVMAIINEGCFYELDCAPKRVSSLNVPVPYNHHLEAAAIPDASWVVKAALEMFGK